MEEKEDNFRKKRWIKGRQIGRDKERRVTIKKYRNVL